MSTTEHPNPGRKRRHRLAVRILAITSVALAATTLGVTEAEAGRGQSDLAVVRAATAEFHRVAAAEADGHQLGWKDPAFPIDGCIAHPTDGAMGYHWFDHDAIEDTVLDPLEPEGLVYEPLPNGQLRLVAVEWIVPKALWDAEHGDDNPPVVLGQQLGVLNPALGWYILHAWVWKPNPSGMFDNWNPDVDCS